MDNVVVRFAPSPTGYLHIGGARTAIFNWLFARKHRGKFILRIEDTDAERSNREAIEGILDGLQWLGLDWDEGPYFQSQYVAEHRAAAQNLLDKGLAYKCFCTKAQLDEKRERACRNKTTYQYERKHGEQAAVHYYREHGFLPWAMVNFLVLLGWSTKDSKDIFSPDELIRAFNLEGINRTNSVFNIAADGGKHFTDPKLISINAHYLRQMSLEALMPYIEQRLKIAGLWRPAFDSEKRTWLHQAMDLIRGRFNTLDDFVTYGQAYIGDRFDMDTKAVQKHLSNPEVACWMPELAEVLARMDGFDAKAIESEMRRFLEEKEIKPAKLMGAVRTAVTGQEVGPDFIKVLTLLGQQCVVDRLRSALSL